MFNIYTHEKRTLEEDIRASIEVKADKRVKKMKCKLTKVKLIVWSIIERNEVMSQKYKQRVGEFIRQVSMLIFPFISRRLIFMRTN